jgi:hypothetical protein
MPPRRCVTLIQNITSYSRIFLLQRRVSESARFNADHGMAEAGLALEANYGAVGHAPVLCS